MLNLGSSNIKSGTFTIDTEAKPGPDIPCNVILVQFSKPVQMGNKDGQPLTLEADKIHELLISNFSTIYLRTPNGTSNAGYLCLN